MHWIYDHIIFIRVYCFNKEKKKNVSLTAHAMRSGGVGDYVGELRKKNIYELQRYRK